MHYEVEAVEKRARHLFPVGGEPLRRAATLDTRIPPRPTRAQIHRSYEHKAGGKDDPTGDAGHGDCAVLERLAQGFDRGPNELSQLVEQEHAVMREARLAGPRPDSTAYDRRRGGGVMRGAERRFVHDPAPRSQEAGHGVDPRHLERFLPGQRREDAGQATREHRLTRAGRACEEEVVATRRGNLEGTPGALLAANVTEIRMRPLQERWTLDDRFWREATPKILSRFDEMAHGHGYDARKGGLGRRLHRADEPIQPGPAGGFRGDEYTRNGTDPPVESQLSHRGVLGETLRRDLARSGEHRKRDRQVEAGPLLAETGGSEVDCDPPQRPLELSAPDPAPDALLGFLAGFVRQSDDHERRHATLQMSLHLDGAGLEPHEGMGDDARQHSVHRRP